MVPMVIVILVVERVTKIVVVLEAAIVLMVLVTDVALAAEVVDVVVIQSPCGCGPCGYHGPGNFKSSWLLR